MAILERLRTKAGTLLAVLIGVALLAFVLSDFLDSGGSLFTRSKYEIAEVFGKSVPYTDYDNLVRELERIQQLQTGQLSLGEEMTDQIRTAAWENLIQDILLEKQYAKLGVDVSAEELSDLIMGDNPHTYIAQLFTNQQTGLFDRQSFLAFMQAIESEDETSDQKAYYLFIENEIYRERMFTKYLNLISKGLYATGLEATLRREQTDKTVDVDFIVQNFSVVSDSAITFSEKDIKRYYNDHRNEYKQDESRDIRFVYFDVIPSEADYEAAKASINEIAEDFRTAENIEEFVTLESDSAYDNLNYANGELPDSLNNFMFSARPGDTYGPYFENGAYKISRLAKINYLPDSVRARHILLQVTQSNVGTIYQEADSLKKLIEGGADFGMLAMIHSADGSAQTGGDLGWFREGEMVKEFSDSCFFAKKGDIKIAATPYGLHIIQILDQSRPVKKVQVGTVIKKVVPSDETDQVYYTMANEFAGLNNTYEKFLAAAQADSFAGKLQAAYNLGPLDKTASILTSAREVVAWAYRAELHDVSGVFELENRYVVATVDQVREGGYIPLNDVRADIENAVRKQKKAERLVRDLAAKKASFGSLESVAANLGLQVQSATGVTYNSNSFGSSGIEPVLVASAVSCEKDMLTDPLVGENGVYLLVVTNITMPDAANQSDLEQLKRYIKQNYDVKANYYAYDALKELAGIKDNRREFF